MLGNNCCLQIIIKGFAEQFQGSHRMGTYQICLEISARIAKKEDLSNYTAVNPPFFSSVNTLKELKTKVIFGYMSQLCNVHGTMGTESDFKRSNACFS